MEMKLINVPNNIFMEKNVLIFVHIVIYNKITYVKLIFNNVIKLIFTIFKIQMLLHIVIQNVQKC